jgi:NitT/TauT family transport system substrate-binding protein
MRTAFARIAMTVALLGCNHSHSGASVRQVRIALPKDPISWLPVRLAQTLGYFKEEDIAVTVSEITGLSKGMEALLGGSVDITADTALGVIQIAAEGRSVQSFLAFRSRPSQALLVSPGASGHIHKISDLKGRRVGVSSLGSPTHWFLNYLLASHGLRPQDVSTISIGSAATSVASVEHNQVDAAILVSNAIIVLMRRYPNLTVLAETRTPEGLREALGVESFPSGVLAAQENWLHANSDTARRFVRAVKKGIQWVGDHSAEQVRAQMSEAERMPDAEADLQAIREFQQSLLRDGVMPAGAPEIVLKVLAVSSEKIRTAHIDLSKIFSQRSPMQFRICFKIFSASRKYRSAS